VKRRWSFSGYFGCGLALIVGFLILPIAMMPVIEWLRGEPELTQFVVIEATLVTLLVTLAYSIGLGWWEGKRRR